MSQNYTWYICAFLGLGPKRKSFDFSSEMENSISS